MAPWRCQLGAGSGESARRSTNRFPTCKAGRGGKAAAGRQEVRQSFNGVHKLAPERELQSAPAPTGNTESSWAGMQSEAAAAALAAALLATDPHLLECCLHSALLSGERLKAGAGLRRSGCRQSIWVHRGAASYCRRGGGRAWRAARLRRGGCGGRGALGLGGRHVAAASRRLPAWRHRCCLFTSCHAWLPCLGAAGSWNLPRTLCHRAYCCL